MRRVRAWAAWTRADAQATASYAAGTIGRAELRRVRRAMPDVPTDADYRAAREAGEQC